MISDAVLEVFDGLAAEYVWRVISARREVKIRMKARATTVSATQRNNDAQPFC